MRRTSHYLSSLALASFLVLEVPSTIAAQNRYDYPDGNVAQQNLREFDEFLSNHPWIAHKLWEKPSRGNSKDFADDNPELKYWLKDHAWAREQFRVDARGFMNRVRDFQRSGQRYSNYGSYGPWNDESTRAEMARFGQFLDDHPGLARELARDPSRMNDPGYVDRHRELREFLQSHPAVRDRLGDNPAAFFGWYGSYDGYHGDGSER